MKKLKIIVLLSIVIFGFTVTSFAQPNVLSAEQQDNMIIVRIDKVTFTCYRYSEGQKYPYFYPLNGPLSGISVTTESSLPYPHHRSLWFGCDKVNGGNYWQEGNDKGQIISRKAKIVKNTSSEIIINNECVWKQPEEQPIIVDNRTITITAPNINVRIIDFNITLKALTDITIKRTNHSLFSARMNDNLSVKKGGTLVNAERKSGEKETAGVTSSWCDYYGERYGITEGLAIFDSPKNIWYPSKWFTRDYGFFSPTNLYWENDEYKLEKSETVNFEYRVIVHSGTTEEADISKLYSEWIENNK